MLQTRRHLTFPGLEFSVPIFGIRVISRSVFSVFQGQAINQAACDLAQEVADEGDALTLGGICQTPSYLSGKGTYCHSRPRVRTDIYTQTKGTS